MGGISELFSVIGNDKLEYQLLSHSIVDVKVSKKDGCNHIKFATNNMSPNDLLSGEGKVGVVVWVSRSDFNNAISKIRRGHD